VWLSWPWFKGTGAQRDRLGGRAAPDAFGEGRALPPALAFWAGSTAYITENPAQNGSQAGGCTLSLGDLDHADQSAAPALSASYARSTASADSSAGSGIDV
jgi:hypothetical protein